MRERNELILKGNILPTIIRITLPSIVGMLGMMIFNIVDTFFVGQLGALELAAISYTFPVILLINSLVFGIGTAAMALFSRAAGGHDVKEKQILATSSLTLGMVISFSLSIIGYFTIDTLFRALGAEEALLPYIRQYMKIWYVCAGFMVIPMLGDSVLRGLGDTFTPVFVMMTVALVNAVLDPLLIFGLGPFPRMGIKGAALATVISRGMAALVSILIQGLREHLLTWDGISVRKAWSQWKRLLYIGLPNSLVRTITPLGTAFFTYVLSRFGHEIVAGYGVAAKVESIFLVLINSFSITAMVFVGQNMGAGNVNRAKHGMRMIYFILLCFGIAASVIFFFTGNSIAGIFNDDPLVRSATTKYLRIVPFGYCFLAFTQISASILNVYHKPFLAGGLSFFQMAVIAVPASYILSGFFDESGVFTAILAGFVITGLLSLFVIRKQSAVHLKESSS